MFTEIEYVVTFKGYSYLPNISGFYNSNVKRFLVTSIGDTEKITLNLTMIKAIKLVKSYKKFDFDIPLYKITTDGESYIVTPETYQKFMRNVI